MNRQTLCMGCMKDKGDANVCPFCGHISGQNEQPPYLNSGLTMLGRYVIGRVLRVCGESVVYIGFDLEQKCAVEIREFFPTSLCTRNPQNGEIIISSGVELVFREYLGSFLEISRAVARLRDLSGVVGIYDIFEFNHSAYVISEHIEGITLRRYIEQNGYMSFNAANKLFVPVVSTMISAHSIGVYHFGISPDTLLVTPDGKLKILDFGLPEAHLSDTEIPAQLFDGYSAIEQYSLDGKKGSWTDVYGLSAVLFFMLTAKNPPSAVQRAYNPSLTIPKELVQSIPVYAVSAIAGGLQVQSEQRIETVERLKSSLTVKTATPEPTVKKTTGFVGGAAEIPTEKKPSAFAEKFNGFWAVVAEKLNIDENKRTNLKYALISCAVSFLILSLIGYAIFSLFIKDIDTDNEASGGPSTIVSDTTESDVSSLVTDTAIMHQVPDLKGKAYDVAVSDYSMFDLLIMGEEYSDSIAAGKIISQNVEPATECAQGSPIGEL